MLRIWWHDKIVNEIVLCGIRNQRMLSKAIMEWKLQYFGHLVGHGDLRKAPMEAKVAGKRWEADIKQFGQTASGIG